MYPIGAFVKLKTESYFMYQRFQKMDELIGVVVSCAKVENDVSYMVSLREFQGDYSWIYDDDIEYEVSDMEVHDKLSIIANFGEWWYSFHKNIYQQLLIEAIS